MIKKKSEIMFCPNCGEKLESPNQNFCSRCGSEIHFTPISETPQVLPEETPVTTPISSIPVSESIPIKKGGPGSRSKQTFAFGFLALFLAGVGFGLEWLAFMRFMMPIYIFPRLPGAPIIWVAALVLHFIGVVFGVVSRTNSKKARNLETENPLEKVGNVFGILGIIANIIPMAIVSPLLMIISFLF